ncbi:MAG: ATP-binding cassette domain-containing protein [Alphaproteobacteria bacterium]|nr:ATP-binding cassette domain-containing protein [Alphaproteobacteria bacterium]
MPEPLLETLDLTTHFSVRGGFLSRREEKVHAVNGVSLAVAPGEVLGIVGESGCGKTTTGKTMLKLIEPTSGTIRFEGRDITRLSAREMMPLRRRMQIVVQDPVSSLNPRLTVAGIVGAPFEIHRVAAGAEKSDRVANLLRLVGLPADAMRRYPHEFSGGQRQRIGIARALALDPRLVIGDEPVSALDVSIQAQIINLLMRLKAELGLTYILISHNLGVVSHISDRVAVMYLGRVVESAPREAIFFDARHPYTQALLSAVPMPVPGRTRTRTVLRGDVPSPLRPPTGCPFHPRCPMRMARCESETPVLKPAAAAHDVACHLHG